MAEFQNVMLVGGCGSGAQLGKRIALHMLHHRRYQVTVLVRPGTENNLEKKHDADILSLKGAKIVQCDIERYPQRLQELLKGIDCVISCVSGNALLAGQRNLIDACKALGVRRFIPSEFGVDVSKMPLGVNPMFDMKNEIREYLRRSGVDYTIVQCGLFPETWFDKGLLGLVDWRHGKATIPGDGNFKLALTTLDDIADSIQDIVENPKSRNATVTIISEVTTWNQALESMQRLSGRTFETTPLPTDAIKRKLDAKDPSGVMLDLLVSEKSVAQGNSQEFTSHCNIPFNEWFGRVVRGQKA